MPRIARILLWIAVSLLGATAVGRRRLPAQRTGQRAVAGRRRRLHLRRRLPVLLRLADGQGAHHRRPPRPGRGHVQRWQGLRAHARSGSSSATTSPPSPGPGRWSGRCWRRSSATCPAPCGFLIGATLGGGVHDAVVLFASHAARREIARPDAQGGDQSGHRPHRDDQPAGDHDHPARRARPGGGEGPGGKPVGPVHHRRHHSAGLRHGRPAQDRRNVSVTAVSVFGVVGLLAAVVGGKYLPPELDRRAHARAPPSSPGRS